jgi:hypothetical protein
MEASFLLLPCARLETDRERRAILKTNTRKHLMQTMPSKEFAHFQGGAVAHFRLQGAPPMYP